MPSTDLRAGGQNCANLVTFSGSVMNAIKSIAAALFLACLNTTTAACPIVGLVPAGPDGVGAMPHLNFASLSGTMRLTCPIAMPMLPEAKLIVSPGGTTLLSTTTICCKSSIALTVSGALSLQVE